MASCAASLAPTIGQRSTGCSLSAFGEAVASADTFFGQELPAVQQWSFRREEARRIIQPVLAVIGEKSREQSPIWNARHEMLLTWLPNAEAFVLPGATHLLTWKIRAPWRRPWRHSFPVTR